MQEEGLPMDMARHSTQVKIQKLIKIYQLTIQVRIEQGWTSSLEVQTSALIGDKIKKNKIKAGLIIISFAALFLLAAIFIII